MNVGLKTDFCYSKNRCSRWKNIFRFREKFYLKKFRGLAAKNKKN